MKKSSQISITFVFLILLLIAFTGRSEGKLVIIDGIDAKATFFDYYIYGAGPDIYSGYLIPYVKQYPYYSQITAKIGETSDFPWDGVAQDTYTKRYVQSLEEKLLAESQDSLKNNQPFVIVAHSWGTVLAYLALSKNSDIKVDKFITLGSPLDNPVLFTVVGPYVPIVNKLTNISVWHNYYAFPCDIVSSSIFVAMNHQSAPFDSCGGSCFFGINSDRFCHCCYFKDSQSWYRIMADVYETPTPTPPTLDIKANGQDGSIPVSANTPVSITASLEPGDQNGKTADWWLACSLPAGWYSLTSDGWRPGINSLGAYPLLSINPVEIFNGNLPVGDYEFYFAVDMNPNGILNEPFYYDVVQVHVTQPINPKIAQFPMTGSPGTSFSHWGTGFSANSTATLHFQMPDGTEYTPSSQTIECNGRGTFIITPFIYTIPNNRAPGTYKWWAVDGPTGMVSNTVSYTITTEVNPTAQVAPLSAPMGTHFSISFSGLSPDNTAMMYVTGPPSLSFCNNGCSLYTDINGRTGSGLYTDGANFDTGTYSTWVVDGPTGKVSNTVSFRITAANKNLTAIVEPLSGPMGTCFGIFFLGLSPDNTAMMYVTGPHFLDYFNNGLPRHTDYSGLTSLKLCTDGANFDTGTYSTWVVDGPTGKVSNTVSFRIY